LLQINKKTNLYKYFFNIVIVLLKEEYILGKKRVCRNLVDGWVLGTHKYIFVRVQVSLLVLNKILGCVFARFLEPSNKSISDINKNETLEFF